MTVETQAAPWRAHANGTKECAPVPYFDRLNYFYGQLLDACDFKTEQAFFREKMKLQNRCLHGYGVVCGLEVKPRPGTHGPPAQVPPPDDDEKPPIEATAYLEEIERLRREAEARRERGESPEELQIVIDRLEQLRAELDRLERERQEKDPDRPKPEPPEQKPPRPKCPAHLIICCGVALDCCGNELVVREPLCFDPLALLSDQDRADVLDRSKHPDERKHGASLYISLCYHERPIEPTRTALPEACGGIPACQHGKIRDGVCVRVTLEPPKEEECGDPCCDPCCEKCVLLARIDRFVPWRPIAPSQVHNEVRRHLTKYVTTRIAAINWIHGAEYDTDQVGALIDHGLDIRFTRPVHCDSLQPGVIETLIYQGGGAIAGAMMHLEGHIECAPLDGDPPHCTRRVRFVYTAARRERLSPGDRLHVVVRAPFILDKCCHAVDGEHIGGWVPFVPDVQPPRVEAPPRPCAEAYGHLHRLQSGNGIPGGNFESWIYVGTQEYVK